MRILHISSGRTYGGCESHIVDLCRGLQAKGHEVYAAVRPTCEWQSRLDFLPEGHIFHVSIRNSFGVLSARRIARFVKENEIDVIHAHLPRDYIPGSVACSIAKNCRFVLSRHAVQPLKPFNRFALKNLSRAIAVSSEIEGSLRSIFPPEKVTSISNGLDIEYITSLDAADLRRAFRSFHEIPNDAFVIANIGELSERAGQKDFVLAANEISKKIPDAFFVIVGTAITMSQSYRNELKRLVGVFGLDAKFLWLDHADDTLSVFSAIDILMPSSDWEYPSREILEAITLGTPVLFSRLKPSIDFCADPKLVIADGDPVAVSNNVHEIFTNREERQRISEMLRNVARERFSMVTTLNQIERLYSELF